MFCSESFLAKDSSLKISVQVMDIHTKKHSADTYVEQGHFQKLSLNTLMNHVIVLEKRKGNVIYKTR